MHTPGPWVALLGERIGEGADAEPVWIVCTEDASPEKAQAVAECGFDAPEANAQLIAAAPDLLEGARLALKFYERNATASTKDLVGRLRAAVAKAKGREP